MNRYSYFDRGFQYCDFIVDDDNFCIFLNILYYSDMANLIQAKVILK
jgi:hypothetical protein